LRDEILERHRWLAAACARQVRRSTEPVAELEQVALIGICKALDRFDPAYGTQFKTFASVTVKGELRRHFRDRGWAVSVPRRWKELHVGVRLATDALVLRLGREPTVAEVAAWLGVSVADVEHARVAGQGVQWSAFEVEECATTDEFEDVVETDHRCAVVTRLLSVLSERDRCVVKMCYFAELPQREIGRRVGVSQMQVSRILQSALRTMRAAA
jgi:RNA polymerase sigma-B factor